MTLRPPRQLLTETILMESKPSTTVASVCRSDVNLTASGRPFPAGWTLLFDEEVIVCSHGVRTGLTTPTQRPHRRGVDGNGSVGAGVVHLGLSSGTFSLE